MGATYAVSVVVAVQNDAPYLRRCLDALVLQTLPGVQVICVDAGSADASPAVIGEYVARCPRVFASAVLGTRADALAHGLELVEAPYVALVDPRDKPEDAMFEKLHGLAQSTGADIVLCARKDDEPDSDKNRSHARAGDGAEQHGQYEVLSPLNNPKMFHEPPTMRGTLYRTDLARACSQALSGVLQSGAVVPLAFYFCTLVRASRVVRAKESYLAHPSNCGEAVPVVLADALVVHAQYAKVIDCLLEMGLQKTALHSAIVEARFKNCIQILDSLRVEERPAFFDLVARDSSSLLSDEDFDASSLDQFVVRDMKSMVGDPLAWFEAGYGPVLVETTHVVTFALDTQAEVSTSLKRILDVVGPNDEVLCVLRAQDGRDAYACMTVRNDDARVFNSCDLFENSVAETLRPARLRGSRLVCSHVVTPEFDASALSEAVASDGSVVHVEKPGVLAVSYRVADLLEMRIPMALPLLASDFYSRLMGGPVFGSWVNIPPTGASDPASLLAADYIASVDAVRSIVLRAEQFPCDLDDRRSMQHSVGALWVYVRNLYQELPYAQRAKVGSRPSAEDFAPLTVSAVRCDASPRPDVSVVIPVYNAAPFIEECMASVLGQTLRNIEVVCVNDGSTDNSLELLEAVAAADSRVLVVSQINGGAGCARNRGIGYARGSYVVFIDPDDFWPSDDVLQCLHETALRSGALVLGGSFSTIDPDGRIIDAFDDEQFAYTVRSEGFRDFACDQFDYGWIRFMYHRSLFVDHGIRFPELTWYEDPVFLANVMEVEPRYYLVPRVVYRYRVEYKDVAWMPLKALDLLRGVEHNMAFARRNGYAALYSLLVHRIEHEYYGQIMTNAHDEGVAEALARIQASLDPSLINVARERGDNHYTLRNVAAMGKGAVSTLREDSMVVRLARKIEKSGLYRRLQWLLEAVTGRPHAAR